MAAWNPMPAKRLLREVPAKTPLRGYAADGSAQHPLDGRANTKGRTHADCKLQIRDLRDALGIGYDVGAAEQILNAHPASGPGESQPIASVRLPASSN